MPSMSKLSLWCQNQSFQDNIGMFHYFLDLVLPAFTCMHQHPLPMHLYVQFSSCSHIFHVPSNLILIFWVKVDTKGDASHYKYQNRCYWPSSGTGYLSNKVFHSVTNCNQCQNYMIEDGVMFFLSVDNSTSIIGNGHIVPINICSTKLESLHHPRFLSDASHCINILICCNRASSGDWCLNVNYLFEYHWTRAVSWT